MTTPLQPSARVRRVTRTASRVVGGRAVVIVIDTNEIHRLDEVGAHIWSHLGHEPTRVDDVVDSVLAAFEIDRATALTDVTAFIGELRALGAVQVESS